MGEDFNTPVQSLVESLKEAKIRRDAISLIDSKYVFECNHGSHEEIIVGKVNSIGWSDEGGLELYVTNPTFFGRPLISLAYHNSEWRVLIDTQDGIQFYSGNLTTNVSV